MLDCFSLARWFVCLCAVKVLQLSANGDYAPPRALISGADRR